MKNLVNSMKGWLIQLYLYKKLFYLNIKLNIKLLFYSI